MATNKTIAPTGVTVQIPGLTDAPDMSVPANAIDKAIDGINTLNSQFVFESKTLGTQTVAGGARAVFNADFAKTGYTLIGIVSIGLSNNYMALGSYTIENTTHAQVVLHNLSSTSTEQTVYVKLLYQKT